LNEPGQHTGSRDYIAYNKSIEYSNINFAVCEMVDSSKNRVPEQFKMFCPFLKEHFYKNYEQLLDFVVKKNGLMEVCSVQIYSMQTHVDYVKLKDKLIETMRLLELDNK
jgi:hypothetical protein